MSSEKDTCINVCLLGISGKAGDLLRVVAQGIIVNYLCFLFYFDLDSMLLSYILSDNGLFQKKSTPPDGRHGFLTPSIPFHLNFQNCLSPSSPPDFQVQSPPPPPPPIRFSIKLLDTVILIILNVEALV